VAAEHRAEVEDIQLAEEERVGLAEVEAGLAVEERELAERVAEAAEEQAALEEPEDAGEEEAVQPRIRIRVITTIRTINRERLCRSFLPRQLRTRKSC